MLDDINAQLYRIVRRDAIARHPLEYVLPDGMIDFGKPWDLAGDWMIVGDVHVPSTDWEFAALVAEVARRKLKRPRQLLLAGDLFNMDKFSSFPSVSLVPSWAQEREAAKLLFTVWLRTFDDIYWFAGNHERRLQRIMVEVLETTDLLSVIISNPDKIRFSNFSYCTIGPWLVVHPRNYSRNQLAVAKQLAHKTRRHVMTFHEHHSSIGWDDSGQSMLVNCGSLVDPGKVAYMTLDVSTTPASMQSFATLINGVPTLYGPPPMTDWTAWTKRTSKTSQTT
jgi:hypothetical protein